MRIFVPINALMVVAVVSLIAVPVLAVPVRVTHNDLSVCDPLHVPELVDELGIGMIGSLVGVTGPFPRDEEIWAEAEEELVTVCEATDDTSQPDAILSITNLTDPPRSFNRLWYVGNPNTFVSNVDGVVFQAGFEDLGQGLAFRIDTKGLNKPLLAESKVANGIFEPGETWTFVAQDFISGGPAGSAADLASIGVAGGSLLGGDSSGSIIGMPVPEPSSVILLGLGLVWPVMSRCRRRDEKPDFSISKCNKHAVKRGI